MNIDCPHCENAFGFVPRPQGWGGHFRTQLTCPHCHKTYGWRFLPQGRMRDQEVVTAFSINKHPVIIQEYDGTIENAKRFATHLFAAWNRIPQIARESIVSHWNTSTGAPFVWLLKDRNERRMRGWAATDPKGLSLFVVDSVAEALPDEHLDSLLIHEFGHFLFVSLNEEHHCTNTGEDRLLRCEKLVWDLTATWGIDVTAALLWMKQHFIDTPDQLQRRDTPLAIEEAEKEFQATWAPLFQQIATFEFPEKYRPYCMS